MLPRWSTPAYRSTNPNRNAGRFISGAGGLSVFASSGQSLNERLRTRARLTNFAVGLILLLLGLSLGTNFTYWLAEPDVGSTFGGTKWSLPLQKLSKLGFNDRGTSSLTSSSPPISIESTIDREAAWKELDHLVMVAGHAIWKGTDATKREDDDDWVLQPIQQGGSVKTFYKHISRGGQTRPDTPPTTESQSYLRLAIESGLLPAAPEFWRVTTEEFALDSFENVLFSLARFKEMTGHWPKKMTVVGFEMKRRRFEQLHRAALKFPQEKFTYIGIDDEGDTRASYEGEASYISIHERFADH
ncbi:hypothetical protein QFC22_005398 [Naganishia vaughanmartiniae]|uniref:Uncharacterized protein n=1 Tax=Naganishia vaughanmartiniae TaxID=1424756 RepID=A0ACC2WUS9_9TREE|nr:hypothetical protein QFC22_005398 [Naganishia vaughanmartiniae]